MIGYRGSGKTSVGQHVARRLGWDFADSDSIITQATGNTIRDIFAMHGEEHFRLLETTAVLDLCKWTDAVIALGGGAILRDANQRAIAGSGFDVIYLHADPEALHQRIQADPQTQAARPSLTHLGGSVDEVRSVLEHRLPIYRRLATHEIDVTHRSIKQVADEIVEYLKKKHD